MSKVTPVAYYWSCLLISYWSLALCYPGGLQWPSLTTRGQRPRWGSKGGEGLQSDLRLAVLSVITCLEELLTSVVGVCVGHWGRAHTCTRTFGCPDPVIQYWHQLWKRECTVVWSRNVRLHTLAANITQYLFLLVSFICAESFMRLFISYSGSFIEKFKLDTCCLFPRCLETFGKLIAFGSLFIPALSTN